MKIKYLLPPLITFIIILQGCSSSSKQRKFHRNQGNKATSVETMTVKRQTISQQISSYGTIEAQDVVKVTPQVSNRITHIYVDLGDTVHEGQKLASIYQTPYRDQYQQAVAQLDQNKASFARDSAQYKRQEKLFKKQLISSETFEQAKATYESSKAQMQASKANMTQSKENLNNTIIRSPVYGVVLTRNVAKGDVASTGQTAFQVANLTAYKCSVYLPRQEWQNVKLDQPVTFNVASGDSAAATGRVSQISPRLDPATGLGQVIISLTDKKSEIQQGVLVQAVINVETHQNAIVLPRAALVENVQTVIQPESNNIQLKHTYSAFVVENDSLALKHSLKLGLEQGTDVEVLQGLNAGDQVVITGQSGLTDSSKVLIANNKSFEKSNSIPIKNGAARQKAKHPKSNQSHDSSSTAHNN